MTTQNEAPKPKPAPGTGTLKKGLKIGNEIHKDFVLREGTLADLKLAEKDANPVDQIAFGAALIAIQLERIGTFEGPFTTKLLDTLSQSDYWRLERAHRELEAAGEA